MPFIRAIVGALSLFLGRQLFWLFVGAAGFMLGFNLAVQLLPDQPGFVVLLIALVAGLAGAALGVFAQRLALGIAGFIAGGYLLLYLANLLGVGGAEGLATGLVFVLFIVGGVLGAILIQFVFDFALILLSSALGATLLTQAAAEFWTLEPALNSILFVVLLLVGIAVQWGIGQRVADEPGATA